MLRGVDHGGRDLIALRYLSGLPDDQDESAAAARAHVRRGSARQLPRADHLGLEMAQQAIAGYVVDAAGDMGAGIAHNNVDPVEGFHGFRNESRDIVRNADVCEEPLCVDRLQLRERAIKLASIAPADRDAAAFVAEPPRNGEPDAAGAAGDQCCFSGDSKIHGSTKYVAMIAAVD